ncbi:hypothetical protein RYX36_001662, partial [Vicia faba]
QSRILDPIKFGEYLQVMQKILGNILSKFSNNDKQKLSGLDFSGINHYTSYYVKDCLYSKCEPGPGITRTEDAATLLDSTMENCCVSVLPLSVQEFSDGLYMVNLNEMSFNSIVRNKHNKIDQSSYIRCHRRQGYISTLD